MTGKEALTLAVALTPAIGTLVLVADAAVRLTADVLPTWQAVGFAAWLVVTLLVAATVTALAVPRSPTERRSRRLVVVLVVVAGTVIGAAYGRTSGLPAFGPAWWTFVLTSLVPLLTVALVIGIARDVLAPVPPPAPRPEAPRPPPPPAARPVPPPIPTTLYRLHAADGALLYVGITSGILATRLADHRAHKPWWPEVADVRTVDFADRLDALAAERHAIATEAPRHNIAAGSLLDSVTTLRRLYPQLPAPRTRKSPLGPTGDRFPDREGTRG